MHTDPKIETLPHRRVAPPAQTRRALQVTSYGMTDVGLVRPSNEDRFLVAPFPEASGPGATLGHLFAVADGVGGARGGDVASTLTMESIQEASLPVLCELCRQRTPRPSWVFDELRALFRRADTRLTDEIARNPELRGMGTTLTVAVAIGRTLFVGHAGDSRCYVVRGGALQRITVDHTVAVELAKLGVIEVEAVAEHPYRNVLSNWIGMGAARLNVEVHEVDLGPGDTVLLCTDGLTSMVPPAPIAAILRRAESPEQACRDLVACANGQGGEDNVTAVVARWALAA